MLPSYLEFASFMTMMNYFSEGGRWSHKNCASIVSLGVSKYYSAKYTKAA